MAVLEKAAALARQRCVGDGWDVARVEELARSYLDVFVNQGYVGLTCREALEYPDFLWLSFFTGLKDRRGAAERPVSPFAGRPDSSWMRELDYVFLNVRATSLEPSKTGTFLQGVKLLPVLRAKGVHLAPFMDCNFGNVYCIDSLTMPSPATLDAELLAAGVGADDQVRLFVDLAHLAGMAVGFDLEPHTSQFSRVVLSNPELFRWVRVTDARKGLVAKDMASMLKADNQKKLVAEVRRVVRAALEKEKLAAVEAPGADPSAIVRAHRAVVDELVKLGLWTLPSHTWGGVGLPDWKHYNVKDNYPVFDYRNAKGEDHAEHAFGMLTPFRFYDDLPINKLPTKKAPPKVNEDVVDFFAGIFPRLHETYGFDFVRLDYVDHVFDSVMDEAPTLPTSDRCIPPVLKRVIDKAREKKPWIGAMAERMGCDFLDYGSVGFDLLLGCDILTPMHWEEVAGTLLFSRELAGARVPGTHQASVQFAVDTHDSGNPLFWRKPISEVVGSQGMLLRQFVGRFASPGSVRRPAYECMGNSDLSHGLFHTNNNLASLNWVGDRNHTRLYHALESAYARFRKLLSEGGASWWISEQVPTAPVPPAAAPAAPPSPSWAAWCVDTAPGADGWRGRLVAVVALERLAKSLKEAAADAAGPYPVVPSLELDVSRDWDRSPREAYEVLLDGSGFDRPMPLVKGRCIRTGSLGPRGYRLFLVRG